MVVVVEAGGAVDHTPEHPGSTPPPPSSWPGTLVSAAVKLLGQLLFGQKNFAGRLPVTWPVSLDQFPTFTRGDQVPNPMEYHVGYRWFDEQGHVPRYYFGHGLSYTTFEIQRLSTPCADVTSNGLIQVEVDVKNTGDRAGDEVVMVFASFPGTQVMRSKKEAQRLRPGEPGARRGQARQHSHPRSRDALLGRRSQALGDRGRHDGAVRRPQLRHPTSS